jgi:hypothetical protein
VPRDIWLSDKAKETFEHFRQFLHAGQDARGPGAGMGGKGATHVLRLAGTLCYLDWAIRKTLPAHSALPASHPRGEPKEIGAGFVTAAITLSRNYFWLWAQITGKGELSVKDVRREGLKHQLDAEQIESLLDRLVKAGWLHKATTKTSGQYGHRWVINPLHQSANGHARKCTKCRKLP